MFYQISLYLMHYFSFFNAFHYVSVRAIASLVTALCCSFVLGPWFIDKSKSFFRSKARSWTPERHQLEKDNMPTMGGIFIVMVFLITVLFWVNITNPKVWVFLVGLIGFGAIGCWDDWGKIKYDQGVSAATKFSLQLLVAGITAWLAIQFAGLSTELSVPFFKTIHPDLGWFFIPWAMLVIIGTSNGVNLTDGLDGLAIGSLMTNFATFSLIAYLAGHVAISAYLHIPFAASAEISVIGCALFGASLGFLWYNAYPAQIFMGDVGSLALGAGLALMALLSKQELLLPLAGGLFVIETITVMLQIASYKLRGKRLFKMAPIHHHFELLGWPESKITVRFAIISFMLCLLALITLKLR